MNLPNIHFTDFPIEFKEINPSDFPAFEVENDKIIIEPNDEGFINDAFQEQIDLRHKNTVVVNAAVGQGKSTAIIKTIKRYYIEHPDTMIIVASPFVSLVQQYCNDIHEKAEIPKEQIYDYSHLGRRGDINYKVMRVQVLTVNTLLGNPGEDAFKNSDVKRKYLNDLVKHCEDNRIKVVFIYDEIHDAIQNFKEEYIFGLWKWRNIVLKNYILSATYNEASKVVIEYLAELTGKKIQIIESKRTIYPDKQSKLFLHYSPAHNFTETNPELYRIVENALKANKKIDILCYSKTLAEDIIKDNTGIGKLLKDRFGEINNCTSELISKQRAENAAPANMYNNTMCNVGTNFKSGVSINKARHAFIIVLPPRATKLWFRNRYGIFSGGVNSIIQSLARQREKGEIHVVLSLPDKFNYQSLSTNAGFNNSQLASFRDFYEQIRYYNEGEDEVNYFPLIRQDSLTAEFYNTQLVDNIKVERIYLESIGRDENLPSLSYPSYKTFKLDKGEEYLANNYKFFGEDISAYMTYAAFTNQFVNCKLSGIKYKTALFFEEGKIQEKLSMYFNIYFGELYYDAVTAYSNFHMFYENIRQELFTSFTIRLKSVRFSKTKTIQPYNNPLFENQLLRFCAHKYFSSNYYYSQDYASKKQDLPFTREDYILDSISVANTIDLEAINYPQKFKDKIKAYKNISIYRSKLIENISSYSRGSNQYNYLPLKPFTSFIANEEERLFNETLVLLFENDDLIKNDVFNFRRNFIEANGLPKPLSKRIESFYKILLDSFFIIPQLEDYPKIRVGRKSQRVKQIFSIKELPNTNRIIDLIHPPQIDEINERELEKFAVEHYGSMEVYQQTITDAIGQ